MSSEPLTFRQKQLWWEFGSAAAALVVFAMLTRLRPSSSSSYGWAAALVSAMWLAPQVYWTLNMYSGALERTDERDREIDARGDLAGLRLLALGVIGSIWNSLLWSSVGQLLGALFVLLCCAQMVRTGLKLRLYAGYRGFFPERWRARRNAKRLRRFADRAKHPEAREWALERLAEEEEKARR